MRVEMFKQVLYKGVAYPLHKLFMGLNSIPDWEIFPLSSTVKQRQVNLPFKQ